DAVRDSAYPRIGIAMMTGSPPPASPPTSAVITICRDRRRALPPVRGTDTRHLHVARYVAPTHPIASRPTSELLHGVAQQRHERLELHRSLGRLDVLSVEGTRSEAGLRVDEFGDASVDRLRGDD